MIVFLFVNASKVVSDTIRSNKRDIYCLTLRLLVTLLINNHKLLVKKTNYLV